MCVVSNIMDYAKDKWFPQDVTASWTIPVRPWGRPYPYPAPSVPKIDIISMPQPYTGPTREQFEELLKLLRAGKRYDEATGQPDCELEDKKKLLRKIAEQIGVEFTDDFELKETE